MKNVCCVIDDNGEMGVGTAKWDDIVKLYEHDKRCVYRLLPRVTDSHMNTAGQSSMKVNLAAQLMSSSVAAGINLLMVAGK